MDDTGKGDNNLANGEQQSHPARQADHGILEHQQKNISTKPDEDFQHFVEYYVRVPEGSTTVLGIMGRMDLVDQVTGGLRLL
ncbi:hypothetical protein HPB51_021152 [Rhipicephalus microplus]|uniref:Uncharacterized protein n=1 Tax=Rhipicephalus microplus TaxID=6941 RepID=A0A9J6DX01_RHIMP|nr:hypothetical protein HPB51_021152 [Rhipicephalus microplus]